MPRARKDPETGLTPKQEKFCVLYVTGNQKTAGNASQCVRRAFNYKKAKPATVQRKAKELLNMATIQARVAVLRRHVAERAEITAQDVLRETYKLAFSDLRKIFRDDGSLKPPTEWPDDVSGAIAGMDIFEEFEGRGEDREMVGHTKKIKLWDKNTALERLFKHFGLYKRDNDQVTDPIKQLLAAISARNANQVLAKP